MGLLLCCLLVGSMSARAPQPRPKLQKGRAGDLALRNLPGDNTVLRDGEGSRQGTQANLACSVDQCRDLLPKEEEVPETTYPPPPSPTGPPQRGLLLTMGLLLITRGR